MLDHCSISHKGGVVLWSRSFTPAAAQVASSPASPVNSLIREVLIEGRTDEKYEKDGYAIQWTFMNELELIFVVAYQRILQLTYVEELLNALKSLFVKLFEPFLATFVASLHTMSNAAASARTRRNIQDWNFAKAFEGWDKVFDKLLRGLQDKISLDKKSRFRNTPVHITDVTLPSDDDATDPAVSSDAPVDAEQIAKNVHTLKSKSRGRGRGRGRGGSTRTDSGSGKDSPHASDSEISKSKKKAKTQRKWGDEVPSESEMASLDFSIDKTQASSDDISATFDVKALIDESSLGTRAQNGLYEIKDWEFSKRSDKETDDLVARTLQAKLSTNQQLSGPTGTLSSLFSRLTGSKTLNESDVRPVLDSMQQHLMKKNVAKEIAEKVCEGVEEGLIGKKLSSFQTVSTSVRQALSTSLTRILTPNTSTDLLMSIRSKLSSPLPSKQQRLPFSIAFVGVNGVGKSTNLSKVCFWLIQNGFKVLIAACDTFRSGAVEQLRVHVRNLSLLDVAGPEGRGGVELFERGYGKDAAGIAKEAITYARDNDFDVVLIDTAGRMQDNEPLMRALAKLVAVNNPDKIIFVGEALVGNEAVDQLTKFDRALKDFSSATGGTGKGRGIDGMLVTKWDTVDDKVGAALSMTFVTGQPIYFVGCGQTYTDLRQLRVSNVVQALLSD